jgi:hypothetical protein
MDFTPNHDIVKWTTADPASLVAESAAQADSIESALDGFGGTIGTISALDLISTAGIGSQYFVTSPGTGIAPLSFRAVSGTGVNTVWAANEIVVANTKTNLDNFITTVAATTNIRFKVGGTAAVEAQSYGYRFTTATGTIVPESGWVTIQSGTITAQSVITFDGLSGFSGYEISLDLPTSSIANQITVRLLAAGVANTAAQYDIQNDIGSGGTAAAVEGLAQTSWGFNSGNRTDKSFRLLTNSLNLPARTAVSSSLGYGDATASMGVVTSFARHRASTVFDGIQVLVSGGTVTGSYIVKGTS